MNTILQLCDRVLADAKFFVAPVHTVGYDAIAFESDTVIGFLIAYDQCTDLLGRWETDSRQLIMDHQFGLRQADAKAWNTYTVVIASARPTDSEQIAIAAIEEDLIGTRKLARAGVYDIETVRFALLPLLPIFNGPRLEAVDMKAEIQLRTTELPTEIVDAFLSAASEIVVAQILERSL